MDEEALVKRMERRLRKTPPRCVRGFQCKPSRLPKPFDDNFRTVWRLACSCGGQRGTILGHALRDYNPRSEGPEFISPLGFKCSACGKTTEVLDTDLHGYHPEVAKVEGGVGSAKIRGHGRRKQYPCPHCGAREFTVTVGFVYWDFDLFLDEAELVTEGRWKARDFAHPEDFFNVFLSYGRCTSCGRVSEFTDFGKL
jgi:hypothetical protein